VDDDSDSFRLERRHEVFQAGRASGGLGDDLLKLQPGAGLAVS
jgi:hypothetical protein